MGMGIGAAMTGLRPIIEGMNMGFLLLAYNQISNNAGMLHYTSGGQFKVCKVSPVFFESPGDRKTLPFSCDLCPSPRVSGEDHFHAFPLAPACLRKKSRVIQPAI